MFTEKLNELNGNHHCEDRFESLLKKLGFQCTDSNLHMYAITSETKRDILGSTPPQTLTQIVSVGVQYDGCTSERWCTLPINVNIIKLTHNVGSDDASYIQKHTYTLYLDQDRIKQYNNGEIDEFAFVSSIDTFINASLQRDLQDEASKLKDMLDVDRLGGITDGYHTFDELYHHRAVLFAVICHNYPNLAWKSKMHDDGDMYDGMFIVGINTPKGQATYHYNINPYWDMFDIPEVERAPRWDGHSSNDAIERIFSLKNYIKIPTNESPRIMLLSNRQGDD